MIIRELINLIGFKINETQYRQAEKRAEVLVDKMQSLGTRMSLLVTAPFVGLNIWLAKTLSNFEQLDVAFATMLGSAEKADELVTDMLEFAAETPFEIKEIGPTVKQLLAMGSNAEIVLDELKMLGDVAAGLGIPISRLALNFGQVRAQTKLTGRELRDFAIAGVPLLSELAKMLGITESAVTEMVSRGAIGFDKVNEAFRRMTEEGGRFHNLMIKQSKTLGGLWSNFLDIITLSARQFEKDLLPMFKKIVMGLTSIIRYISEKVSPTMKLIVFWMAALLAAIGPLLLGFSGIILLGKGVAAAYTFMTAAAAAHNITVGALMVKYLLWAALLVAIIALIALLIEDFILYTKNQDSLIGKILPPWEDLKKGIQGVYDALFNLGQKSAPVIREMINHWNTFFEQVGGGLFKIQKFLENLQSTISKFWFGEDITVGLFGGGRESFGELVAREERERRERFAKEPQYIFPSATRGLQAEGGGIRQFNINSTINTTVPAGTSEEQITAIDKQARQSVYEQFQQEIRSIVQFAPEVE